jgi:D-arabinitol dehydrogenase (NADP+)
MSLEVHALTEISDFGYQLKNEVTVMQALQYDSKGKLRKIVKEPEKPASGEILIKVAYSGVCGTDLHILAGEAPVAHKVILGHEFSGIVERCGKDAGTFKPGQRVAVDPNNFCGTCQYCRDGLVHFCENLTPVGIHYDGGWAEYSTVKVGQVHALPDNLPLEVGALAEPMSCILHGWDRLQPLKAEQRLLILGSGLIGLLWGLYLRHKGFSNVTYSEPRGERRKLAAKLNFPAYDPLHLNELEPFDVIIDCSGNPQALSTAINLTNPMAKILFFGVCPQGQLMTVEPFRIFQKELTLLGSFINPFTFSRAVSVISEMDIPLSHLGVGFFKLSEYESALRQAREGNITKAFFKM